MTHRYTFNRLELAGSLGDLGTLLPLAIGMILINKLDPAGLFFSIGLYYILAGIYFGVTVPVQPMKVVGAYAIAMGLSASQIMASSLWLAGIFIVIGATGAMDLIGKYTPKPVVRGVQLSTGVLLMAEGVRFMVGTSKFQIMAKAAEPFLTVQNIGPLPIGIIIGALGGLLTLLLLENRTLPAGLLVVCGGGVIGLILGTRQGFEHLQLGLHLPPFLPFPFPNPADFASALLILVLPQIPMTLGNAVIAYADLSNEYFGEASRRVTYRAACISIAIANFVGFLFGGMPLCHGAGGLRRPSPVRGPHGRLQPFNRGLFHPSCDFLRRSHPDGSLSAADVDPRGPAHLRRRSTGADGHRPEGPQGSLRGGDDAGHHPGLQPGGRFPRRSGHCLPVEVRPFERLRPLINESTRSC